MQLARASLPFIALLANGCALDLSGQPGDAGPSRDAGADGGGGRDAGRPDAGRLDAGRPDAGRPDAGRPDAGRPDAGRPDAGPSPCAALIGVPVPGFSACDTSGGRCEHYYDAPGNSRRSCDEICMSGGLRCVEAFDERNGEDGRCDRDGAVTCDSQELDGVCVCAP